MPKESEQTSGGMIEAGEMKEKVLQDSYLYSGTAPS